MMKTHDEIKKGLSVCMGYAEGCAICPYYHDKECQRDIKTDALTYIQQLEAERDAAVKDCGCFPCQTCEERENGDLCRMCEIEGGYRSFHQWRGVQKEDTDAR